jgi:hypothetical protein
MRQLLAKRVKNLAEKLEIKCYLTHPMGARKPETPQARKQLIINLMKSPNCFVMAKVEGAT